MQKRDGYQFNISVILQFHPLILTRADQGLDVSCFFAQPITRQELDRSVIRSVAETSCRYTLHRFNPTQCVALDAKVGETLYHRWSCDSRKYEKNLNYKGFSSSISVSRSRLPCSIGANFDNDFRL